MQRLDSTGVKAIVEGIVHGLYYPFTAKEVEWGCAMPILFGGIKDEDIDDVGVIVGVLKSAHVQVNGSPMCAEVIVIHKEDWPKVQELWKKVAEAEKKTLDSIVEHTSESKKRGKKVGVQKSVGGSRRKGS